MNLRNTFNLGVKELRGLWRDPVMLVLIVYSFSLSIWTSANVSPEALTNAAISIVDEDQSHLSARITSAFYPPYFVEPQMTTTAEILPDAKEILLHQAKAVGNDPDDRACRTKIVAEPVGDFEKLFREWDRWGWHRVTFYGDLKKPVYDLADAIGWKVVEEA